MADRAVLQKLVSGLIPIFDGQIEQVILYGSVARGNDTPESDMDIAVLVHSYTPAMHDAMTDLIVDLELEYDVVLSVLLIDVEEFKVWENTMPFYRNVRKDGITLWTAA